MAYLLFNFRRVLTMQAFHFLYYFVLPAVKVLCGAQPKLRC